MMRATLDALEDAGGKGLAASIDRIAVPQGSWTYPDPARLVADGIGSGATQTHLVELGIPQQSLLNEAMAAILSGASEVAVVVGGEAKRWARDRERAGQAASETPQGGAEPDVIRRRQGPLLEPVEVAHRLWDPVQQYAMIESALRASLGRSVDDHRRAVAALWARFAEVAASNPTAAFPAAVSAEALDRATSDNRPLAFPYNKWHSTQWTVNQAASVVLCSAEAAERHGVPQDRWIFPRVGLESSSAVSLLCRRQMSAWPAMEVLGETAAVHLGRPLADVPLMELYSCFPAAVEVQQQSLGLDPMSTPTITGGMAFAGGPFNNFVLQALVAVVERLRAGDGDPTADDLGVITTVSGLLTKPGLDVWATRPEKRPPLLSDLAYEVAAVTETIPAVETLDGYAGPGRVAAYTVTFAGLEPERVVAICDTADGRRCVSFSDDRVLAAQVCEEELVGSPVLIGQGTFSMG
jgi:acetyl-CoA C-acetyltransferase